MEEKKTNPIVPIYGSLIVKGKKVITEVPEENGVREEVAQWLVDNGHSELADEEL